MCYFGGAYFPMKRIYIVLFILIFLAQYTVFVSADDRLQITAQKTNKTPEIDGVITEEEWGDPIMVLSKDRDKVKFTSVIGEEGRFPTDAELYVMWDDEYLYIGAIVTIATHQNNKGNPVIWREDSLSLKMGMADNQKAEYRFIFALGSGNVPLGYLLSLPNEALDGTGTGLEILLHYSDYNVARTENETTYEIKIRWDDYTLDERKIEKGFQFYLNMELHMKIDNARNPGRIMFGTYDDSTHWQYPLVKLEEQDTISSPTPRSTITLAPAGNNTEKIDIASSGSWWYWLIPAPLAATVATIFFIRKKRKRTAH